MLSLYVSASKVDEFRKMVLASDYETWLSEAKLIAQIREPQPQSWQMRYGEALHGLIEQGGGTEYTNREGVTTRWPAEIVEVCSAVWPRPCAFEIPAYKDYSGPGWTVTVGSRIDAAHGLRIIEGKTKFGSVTPTDYAESLQWPLYLDANPWARSVEYRIHEIGGMRDEDGELRVSRDGPTLKTIHTFSMWRQPGLDELVGTWVGRFAEWAQARGLEPYLQPQRAA